MSDPDTGQQQGQQPPAGGTTPPADPPTGKQGDPDEPLGEGGKKALEAERTARAAAEKQAAALQKQIDEAKAAQLSDLERAQKAAADAQAVAEKATAEALRYRIAAKHAISDEDAELFLTGMDEATVERQAARLVERTPSTPTTPKPDLSQGGKQTPPSGDDEMREFARGLFANQG